MKDNTGDKPFYLHTSEIGSIVRNKYTKFAAIINLLQIMYWSATGPFFYNFYNTLGSSFHKFFADPKA